MRKKDGLDSLREGGGKSLDARLPSPLKGSGKRRKMSLIQFAIER